MESALKGLEGDGTGDLTKPALPFSPVDSPPLGVIIVLLRITYYGPLDRSLLKGYSTYMRKTIKVQPWLIAGFALICLATGATAQTVSMQLIGPPPGPNLGGFYTAPYIAIIGAPGQSGPLITGVTTDVICDDFQTDVSTVTPPWQALVTNLESVLTETSTNQDVQYDTTASVSQQQTDYEEAAYLAIEIVNTDQSTPQGQLTSEELSYALWAVFDPASDPTGPLSDPALTSSQLGDINSDLQNAVNVVEGGDFNPSGYNINIYTPNPLGASQEYLSVTAPEAATPVLLAVDLLSLLALVTFLRRRASRGV